MFFTNSILTDLIIINNLELAFILPVAIFVEAMKSLKGITISLIISLTVFVWVEKEFALLSDSFGYVLENAGNGESSSNTFANNNDTDIMDIALIHDVYSFNLKCLHGERVHFFHFIPSQILSYTIWQPPKIS